ncbi:hypothetical protein ACQU0X_30855 [Pseudovibrio ascidiaceicola]|uniref:hypothetical protein n=1 Tax=Pseudovibrio ascidiaceicola TaxID=285279 RepID=UPI003D361F5A
MISRSIHPISISPLMMHRLIDGHLSEIRRPAPYQKPEDGLFPVEYLLGDLLWVQEAFSFTDAGSSEEACLFNITYSADDFEIWHPSENPYLLPHLGKFNSSAMPKELTRYTLELTGVRSECLQDITEKGAEASGVKPLGFVSSNENTSRSDHRIWFAAQWDAHYEPQLPNWQDNILLWDKNPFVEVLTFKVHEGTPEQVLCDLPEVLS